MSQDALQSLLERNKTASVSWHPMPSIEDMRAMNLKVKAIVTCADARADPAHYFGLSPGEAVIMRNAGGRISDDVLKTLELIGTLLDIGLIMIIHHTGCGCISVSDDYVRSTLSKGWPEHAKSLEDRSWGSFIDIGMEQSVRDDVAAMKKWKFLSADTLIAGYVFDIKTGQLELVDTSST